MLTLEKNNIPLHTSEDFSVQIEDQSPFTKFDEIQGTKAIGITLPGNDFNRKELDQPGRFEKQGSKNDRKYDGYALRHHGQVIMSGTLIVESTKKEYSGWLRDAIGDLAERVKGKYINQTALGGEQTFENKSNYDPETDGYCCPKIFNRFFWRDRGKLTKVSKVVTDLEGNEYNKEEEIGELSLQFFNNQQYFVNFPGETGVVSGGTNYAPVVTPFLFLWKAVEMIFWDQKIQVTENFLKTDPDLTKLCIYHTFNIVKQLFTIETKLIYPTDPINDPQGNESAIVDIITDVVWGTDKFNYKDCLPKMPLGEFLIGLQNKLNIVFDFNGLDEVRIIDRETVLKSEAFDLEKYAVGDWDLGTRKDVCIKLQSDQDNNDAAFSDAWQDLSDLREYIKDSVVQRTNLDALTPDLDEIRLVEGEGRYYQYHWYTAENDGAQENVLGWEKLSIRFQPYFGNDGDRDQEEISSKFGNLRQSEHGYPIVQQQGNAAAFRTQFTTFAPRLMFYLGDDAASFETSNLSLDYDGDTGLVNKRFRFTLPFLANALPAKRTFKLPASVYYYVRQNKSAMAFRTREGSFILDSISAIAERSSMIEAEFSVLKREDNFWEFETGNTPGTGGHTTPDFVAKYVGVTAAGKPFLIDASGKVKNPPAWGALSQQNFAGACCIDYVAADHLLFVGSVGGIIDIYNLSNLANLQKKSIRIFTSSAEITGVRVVNGHILVGTYGAGDYMYVQPYFSTLAGYADVQAYSNAGHKPCSGVITDFIFADGWYYGCTRNGEIFRGTDLVNWVEILDLNAQFVHMLVTDTRLWVFDDNDRNCYMERSDVDGHWWHEFDLTPGSGPVVMEAVALDGDSVMCITKVNSTQAIDVMWITTPAQHAAYHTPPLATQSCGGAAVASGEIVVSVRETTGATKVAIWHDLQQSWSYLVVPEFYVKLFGY